MDTKATGGIIKIRRILTDESQAMVLRRPAIINLLSDYGIEFTETTGRDIDLMHYSLLEKGGKFDMPAILLERIDSAVVLARKEISDPNVIGIIKNTILRTSELNNAVYTYGRYHATIISNLLGAGAPVFPDPVHTRTVIPEDCMQKLECGFTYGSYDHLRSIFSNSVPPDNTSLRLTDVSFAGTVNYGAAEIINIHRKQAAANILQMKSLKVNVTEGRLLNYQSYVRSLMASKICVSPWGLGEACYRDFEAILCGCVLVKPDSSFVKSAPDIYQNNITYVPCKADFSDIENVCNTICSNWNNYLELRTNAYELVKAECSDEAVAKRMNAIFRRCYGRISSP
jgi:hypothetical protein